MILFKRGEHLRKWLESQPIHQNSIGFVPTMGALHEGHLSLIRRSLQESKLTICSIFVNPTQFNDPKDLQNYPVTIEKDIELLEGCGCDILFLPSVEEIFPEGTTEAQSKQYDLGRLEHVLEGKFRPGHFQGVCLVVHRLLNIISPGRLFLGQKDFQQCMVIRKLTELENIPCEIIISPTTREQNGLAMSSRNLRLSPEERQQAGIIYTTIKNAAKQLQQTGTAARVIETAIQQLENAGLRPEYVEVANTKDLTHAEKIEPGEHYVVLTAAWLNNVRLIDNVLIDAKA